MRTLEPYGGRQALDFVDSIEASKTTAGSPVSIARLYRIFLFLFHQPFSQLDKFFTMRSAFQFEKTLH